MTNTQRQIQARRVQLAAVRKQIRSAGWLDDIQVLKNKEAFLLRVIANLQAK